MPRSIPPFSLSALVPLVAATVGAVYTAASILPVPATWLWLYCFTPVAAVATFASLYALARSRVLVVLAVLVTPAVSGFVPALVPLLSFADASKAFELGALASLPIMLGIMPSTIAWHRVGCDGANVSAGMRRLWLVTATTIAIMASLAWNPPETVLPLEPSLAPLAWEPPHATWVDEFRSTAAIAFFALAVAIVTTAVVMKLDRDDLRKVGVRSRDDSPALGPYRHVDAAFPKVDALAPLRRAVWIDLACFGLVVSSGAYLASRLHHLEANMEVASDGDADSRSVAFPSLRYACSLVNTDDRWDEVNAKLGLARATHETIATGDYRWQPSPPRPRHSRGSCHVTFDVDRSFSFRESVRSVTFSENEATD